MAKRNIFEETSLGSGEEALQKFITPSEGSSIIARYIQVDRNTLGIKYKHAFMITTEARERKVVGGEVVFVTRLGIVHYTMKSWDKCLKQFFNPFKGSSFGEVTKAELVVHSKFNQDGSSKTTFADDPTNLLKDCYDGKFYLVTHPEFPQTVDDRKAAVARADELIAEDAFSFASRNCQHLITDILLGKAISRDGERNKPVAQLLDLVFGQSCVELVCRLPFIRYQLENPSCSSGFLSSLLSSVGDAEILGRFSTPLQTVMKDAHFTLLLELAQVCLKTIGDPERLYKEKKTSREIALIVIERFKAASLQAGVSTALSALSMQVFGCTHLSFIWYAVGFIVYWCSNEVIHHINPC